MRILRITRAVADVARAEAFYRDALGFSAVATAVMRLGAEEIGFERDATAYPDDSRSDDLWFQHLAIVVGDLDAAYAHLCAHPGWTAISAGGPQLLPPENGAVRAFKFRDPDGNPLELIWFPGRTGRALFLGIDHSAIAVADTARSVAFYRGLGFSVGGGTLNQGPAQGRLDGLAEARVQVTSLRPESAEGMGLELLAYQPPGRGGHASRDCVMLAGAGSGSVTDPDGHRLILQGAGVPD